TAKNEHHCLVDMDSACQDPILFSIQSVVQVPSSKSCELAAAWPRWSLSSPGCRQPEILSDNASAPTEAADHKQRLPNSEGRKRLLCHSGHPAFEAIDPTAQNYASIAHSGHHVTHCRQTVRPFVLGGRARC